MFKTDEMKIADLSYYNFNSRKEEIFDKLSNPDVKPIYLVSMLMSELRYSEVPAINAVNFRLRKLHRDKEIINQVQYRNYVNDKNN